MFCVSQLTSPVGAIRESPLQSPLRWFIFLSFLSLTSCSLFSSKDPIAFSGLAYYSMPWSVKIDALPPNLSAPTLQQELQQTLDNANKVLSTYQPDTELMRFNSAPIGVWQATSLMLFEAVTTAVSVSQQTQGVYDVTVAPLVNLWGFGAQAVPNKIPSAEAIQAARAKVGWQHIGLDNTQKKLQRQTDIQLDLSSIGEGVGVDALEQVLVKHHIHHYMISVAGTLRTQGQKLDGSAWRIAIEKPDGSGLPERVLNLGTEATAISTSGAYRNYHEIEGMRYSHTIDPRTGKPITHKTVSVTVVLPKQASQLADAWATALNALGAEEGYTVAVSHKIPAYYLVKTEQGFSEKYTPAFKPFLIEDAK